MDVKTAIDNLLSRGEITKAEHEKVSGLLINAPVAAAAGQATKGSLTGVGSAIKDIASVLGVSAFAGLAGYQLYDLLKQKRQQAKGFSSMMAKNPNLSEYPEEQVRDYYGVVETFSPKSASNPLVSGALVNKMIQFGGVDHKIVQDLAGIEGEKADILGDVASSAGASLVQFPQIRM